jgi:hypothetical protein
MRPPFLDPCDPDPADGVTRGSLDHPYFDSTPYVVTPAPDLSSHEPPASSDGPLDEVLARPDADGEEYPIPCIADPYNDTSAAWSEAPAHAAPFGFREARDENFMDTKPTFSNEDDETFRSEADLEEELIREELASYNEDSARSNEEGWFYSDDDDEQYFSFEDD